jgi:hypothetical protein
MTDQLTILDALDNEQLLGGALKSPETFDAWRALYRAIFGLPMDDAEADLFRQCTGRQELPVAQFRNVHLVCGRRSGKSFSMALLAVFLAAFKDWRRFLSPGERAVVQIVASDRDQSKVVKSYCEGILENSKLLSQLIVSKTADSIELANSVAIEVSTCSYRTIRGRSVCVAILDEVAFWKTPDSVNPEVEVWRAIQASMATFGKEAITVVGSSPYARRGLLWDSFKQFYGTDDKRNLVWRAPSKVMNPTLDDEWLAEEQAADPASFKAEYLAEFRDDISSYIDARILQACVVENRFEIAPTRDVFQYWAHTDPSGGGADDFTLAIGHREGNKAVIDALRCTSSPFSPDDVVGDYANLLRQYRITTVYGDNYAGDWPKERFRSHGIQYERSAKTTSELFRECIPLLNSGRLEILDHKKTIQQFLALERRTSKTSRGRFRIRQAVMTIAPRPSPAAPFSPRRRPIRST